MRSKGRAASGGGQGRAGAAVEVGLAPEACRRRREALGLSVYELSRCAGLEERTVLRFEAALVRPRPVTVVALRNALSRAERERGLPDQAWDAMGT